MCDLLFLDVPLLLLLLGPLLRSVTFGLVLLQKLIKLNQRLLQLEVFSAQAVSGGTTGGGKSGREERRGKREGEERRWKREERGEGRRGGRGGEVKGPWGKGREGGRE